VSSGARNVAGDSAHSGGSARANDWYCLCSLASRMNTTTTAEHAIVEDYWADLNRDILSCLAMGPISPSEIGRRLGISEGAAASCLSLLAAEGRVRICLVEKGSSPA
jgi:hypothetical protein